MALMRTTCAAVAAAAFVLSGAGTAAAQSSSAEHPPAFPEFDWANDASCTPSVPGAQPVLLVHGTWSNAEEMEPLGRGLADEGYCVFAVNYGADDQSVAGLVSGQGAVGDMSAGAAEIHRAIRHVAEVTGSPAIDVVGHSQGAAMIKLAMNDYGDADLVDDAIYLAGTHKGTTLYGVGNLDVHSSPEVVDAGAAVLGRAPMQQLVGSAEVAHLNSLPDTQPGVDYTVLVSRNDQTATRAPEAFLEAGPGATVTNVVVQDVCPDGPAFIRHVDMRDGAEARELVSAALAGRPVVCAGAGGDSSW